MNMESRIFTIVSSKTPTKIEMSHYITLNSSLLSRESPNGILVITWGVTICNIFSSPLSFVHRSEPSGTCPHGSLLTLIQWRWWQPSPLSGELVLWYLSARPVLVICASISGSLGAWNAISTLINLDTLTAIQNHHAR